MSIEGTMTERDELLEELLRLRNVKNRTRISRQYLIRGNFDQLLGLIEHIMDVPPIEAARIMRIMVEAHEKNLWRHSLFPEGVGDDAQRGADSNAPHR